MVDLRERVEEDRGLLKRIQLHIPGFAGYRRKEDLRTADNMLRIQVANQLKEVRGQLEDARSTLTSNYQLKALEPMGAVIFKCESLEGQIRHAEQGYSGLVADIKVLEPQLNNLYMFDATILDAVDTLGKEASGLQADAGGDVAKVMTHVQALQKGLSTLESNFKQRMNVITGTAVT